jgi:hypothetical protein
MSLMQELLLEADARLILLFSVFSAIDLIEKALRKLGKRALRNEIDVTEVWLCCLSVSPTNVGLYSPVVTYFILACLANFSLFYGVLIFLFLFLSRKKEKHNINIQSRSL